MMKRKGQVIVFEQVLIFAIGIVILMSSLSLFTMYQNYYVASTSQNQITEIKEYMLSNVIEMCGREDANATDILSIPKTIGGHFYKISLSGTGVNVTSEPDGSISDFSPLYGLNQSFVFSGMVISDTGKVVIYKSGNAVTLDRR